MNILVTGGAGYIGSHATRTLMQLGHTVWVYDNLSRGHRDAVPTESLIEGQLHDQSRLEDVLRKKNIDAVMHFAAYALVGESVEQPSRYYDNNVVGSVRLLEAMRRAEVSKMVFSSTTATYGNPRAIPITEDEPQLPINPYGFSKLVVERALEDYRTAYGFGYAALRYFNAAGACAEADLGEDHDPETHLIPIVLQVALGQRDQAVIFGDDYPTPDGTCVRDYVHVDDLATAHAQALHLLDEGRALKLNLGIGKGFSVRQVIEACREVTGHAIPASVGPRRAGDPDTLVADNTRARQILNWCPRYTSLSSIVESAWRWHRAHPHGYASDG